MQQRHCAFAAFLFVQKDALFGLWVYLYHFNGTCCAAIPLYLYGVGALPRCDSSAGYYPGIGSACCGGGGIGVGGAATGGGCAANCWGKGAIGGQAFYTNGVVGGGFGVVGGNAVLGV